jgi:LPXTG-motif cell wall-anchored protein
VTVSAPAEKEEKNGISTLTILGVIGLGLLGGLMVFKKKRA